MKIHLSDIEYKTKPLVWTYDPSTDEAVCDMDVLKPAPSEEYFPEDILNDLKDKAYPFISIHNGEATISGLSDVLANHPMHPIPYMNKNLPHAENVGSPRFSSKSSPNSSPKRVTRSASKLSNLVNAISRSHSSHKLRRTPSTETEHEAESAIDEVKTVRTSATLRAISKIEEQLHNERFDYRSIELDKLVLFEEDQTLWRNTLAMLGDFSEKLAKEMEGSSDGFLTARLLTKQLTLKTNPELYAARAGIVKQLGDMLTSLNIVFAKVSARMSVYHREALYGYFQDALEEAMSVSPVISRKTEFETLDKDELSTVFKGNSFWQQNTHQKALKLRYKIKTAKLTCLLKENVSIDLGGEFPDSDEIENILSTFLETSAFEKALSQQPAINETQRASCSLLLSFNNKVKAFYEHDHKYKRQLRKLRENNPPVELDFDDYLVPEVIAQVRQGLELVKRALQYQALSVYKNELDNMQQVREELLPQLKLVDSDIFDVTEMEVYKRTLGQKINHWLAEDQPVIATYQSLKHFIANILKKSFHRTKSAEAYKASMNIAERAVGMITIALSLCPPNQLINAAVKEKLNKEERKIAGWIEEILGDAKPDDLTQRPVKIPTVSASIDKNIYLSPEWVKKLSTLIKGMDELAGMKENPNKKNTEAFCKGLVFLMVQFYLTELNIVELPEHRLAMN